MLCFSEDSCVGCAEVAAQSRQEKWHAAVARSTFASKNAQNTSASEHFWKLGCAKMARRCGAKNAIKQTFLSTFGSLDVQKLHAAVARSTFAIQNAQNISLSVHFWALGCGKFARGCSEKHICKSKC